jgi:predicted AAA+ superfamily ATPase
MIKRILTSEIEAAFKEFKAICITGPRQSGKTTLAQKSFPKLPYVSLEDPDNAMDAHTNGRAFLEKFKSGAILDEVQRVPDLFRYLQTHLDKYKRNGQFVLSGSNNFLMQQNISQTLAGRVAYIDLLPLSIAEILSQKKTTNLETCILQGGYPSIVNGDSTIARWMPNYIKTYLDRDVRLLRNIGNIRQFNQFIKLCAARAGQILNIQGIATDIGVDHKTIQAWLSVLESSYIVFLLQPYYQNFNKRVIKTPKIYFYDTGLLCHLLGIKTTKDLKSNQHFGNIFENFIISELRKNRTNHQQSGDMYFFRDSAGNEVDVILEKDGSIIPIEIKSSVKFDSVYLKNIRWWQKLNRTDGGMLIYSGVDKQDVDSQIEILNWKRAIDV